MLISIIIPVFNVERWLTRCLDSILCSIPEESEIILVISDSSDNSNKLCMEYASSDNRIKVITQDGKGLANARNCGFDYSSGKFISYIDSDDFVDRNLYSNLIYQINNINVEFDIAMTDYHQVTSDGKLLKKIYQIGEDTEKYVGEDFLGHVLKEKKCFWNVWRYIYRREFLEIHGIRFLEGSLSEDMDYIAKVYASHPRFIFFHCPFYNYCVGRGDSLMDRPTLKRLTDTVVNIKNSIALLDSAALDYSAAFISQYQFEYILNLALCVEVERSDRSRALSLYKENMDILERYGGASLKLYKCLLSLLPLSITARCLHMAKIIKRRIKGDARKSRLNI